jgi:hypothetical protein
MKKTKSPKKKLLKNEDIDRFCQGVEDVLSKISERCEAKTVKKQRKKS